MKKAKFITAWTDCEFPDLGDHELETAPIRHVNVVDYDGKLATITFSDTSFQFDIPPDLLYTKRGRYGQVARINVRKLERKFL